MRSCVGLYHTRFFFHTDSHHTHLSRLPCARIRHQNRTDTQGGIMKKLVLIAGILASALSVGMGAMSENELERAAEACLKNHDKSACQALIDDGNIVSVERCGKNNCSDIGFLYVLAGHYREAILYTEKAIALGDNVGYGLLGAIYGELNDYFNAKKYFEIGCNEVSKIQAGSCFNLGQMYYSGRGVRQDYHKAAELYKKACDLGYQIGCDNYKIINEAGY